MKIIKMMSLGLIVLLILIGLMGCSPQEGIVKFDLETSTEGEGTIILSPDQNSYQKNSEVELTAEPASGYGFVKWKGDISETQKTVKIVMDSDITIIAEFKQKKVSTPTISPLEDTYNSPQDIEINCSTSNVNIYYTVNGEEPDQNNYNYSINKEPLNNISVDTTVKARAYKKDWQTSKVAAKQYDFMGTLKWKFTELAGAVETSPALADDGTIYIGSDDTNMYAINPDGTKKWKYSTRNTSPTSPLISDDGSSLYTRGGHTDLYSIITSNSDERKEWRANYDGMGYGSPTLNSSGNLYINSRMGESDVLLSYNSEDGNRNWKIGWLDSISYATIPAIDDNLIFFGGDNGSIYVYVDNGGDYEDKDKYTTNDDITSTPALGENKTIYFGNDSGKFYSLKYNTSEEKFAEVWTYPQTGNLEYAIKTNPAIASDRTIYFGCNDGNLYALNSDGTEKWKFTTGDKILSSPAIGSDGTIYFGSNDGYFYAVNPDGTKKWSFNTGSPIKSSPAIAKEGIIYFGCDNGKFYALESEVDGLANSAWPMFHHDLHHTGRIGY